MIDWLANRAQISPMATAVVLGEKTYSYEALDALVNKITGRLAPLIDPGDRLAVLLPNTLVYVALIHAAARLGVILVPLNTRLTAHELAWQLTRTSPQVLVFCQDTAERAQPLKAHVTHFLAENRLINGGLHEKEASNPPFSLENRQSIIFTSGTSGQPKGALLTFSNHFYSATASAFRLGVDPGDRWLSCLPLYHVGGMAVLFRSCLYGSAVVLHEGYDVERISDSLDNQGITLISLVPTMVQRLLAFRNGRPWPPTLRHLLLGGAAASEELWRQMAALNIPVSPTYGLTEAASQVATMTPEKSRNKPGSAGKPLLFTEIQIVDPDRHSMPAGDIGEIVVSGPTIMAGYYQDADRTAETIRNGRLFTGDMGYLDADGDLWLVQRRSDMIVSGGENVYPVEVEGVLKSHRQVLGVCVVGIPDAQWGQRVAAMVVYEDDGAPTAEDLIAYCRERLAGYKIPRIWHFSSSLPQTASGKIHRQKVRDLLQKDQATSR